jgi:branched-chain amino acid transport system permease protein
MLSYLVAILTFGTIYALLALGLNLMWGIAGMVNLGILGYYALGGYVSALVTLRLGLPVSLGMVLGAVTAAIFGAATCVGLVKLRDDYLAIVTLGFAEVMRNFAENELWLTNGTDGLIRVPKPALGLSGQMLNIAYLGICAAVLALCFVAMELLRTAPFGRALRAIRADPLVAATAGKNVLAFRIKVLAVGGFILGLAGALYAHYLTYISPEIFQPQLLIYVFLALILGGRGNNRGAVLGTFLVVFLVEGTRFLAGVVPFLSAVQLGSLRALVIGVGFIVVLQKRPEGLLPEPRRIYPDPAA